MIRLQSHNQNNLKSSMIIENCPIEVEFIMRGEGRNPSNNFAISYGDSVLFLLSRLEILKEDFSFFLDQMKVQKC